MDFGRGFVAITCLLFALSAQGQQHGIIASSMQVSGGYTGILDDYSGAGAAYGVRKLRNAYSGSCIRVLRSSDNAEQDIGFDGSGNLDASALSSFIGANTGYVAKWYDQSGNGFDALGHNYGVNTTTLPEIRISGTNQTLNSVIAIKISGTRRFAWTNTGKDMDLMMTFSPKATMIMAVGQIGSTPTSPMIIEWYENSTGNDYLSLYESGGVRIDFGNGSSSVGGTFTNAAQKCWYGQVNGSTYTVYENNTSIGSAVNGGAQSLSGTGINAKIGGGTSASNMDGYIQELIVWPTSQESNRSGIFTNVDTYFSIP
jgi:hypothetical protein